MSDIVEELREHIMLNFTTDARDEIVEAVSEIERLRAERDELRRQLECHTIIIDGMRELRAERDALREALTSIANRECGDEDEASRLANRCLRQIDAARKA
jgi:SMC interacting uncharacterized protein involved in chromosome segregation